MEEEVESVKEQVKDTRLNMQATLEMCERVRGNKEKDDPVYRTLETMEKGIQKWVDELKEVESDLEV